MQYYFVLSKFLCHYTGFMKLGPGTSMTSGAYYATIAFQTASWLCSSRPGLLVPGMLYLLVTVPSYSGLFFVTIFGCMSKHEGLPPSSEDLPDPYIYAGWL